ncbi:hypothetical protein ACNRWW_07435 [Metabacillus sp. HB246100]|uniref:hypothetical protein n=1 Tax=Bacillus weihaiensis TaxID=1547283 RepID=UPI002355F87F|nr:hypothetical protein [Bacillus weihaiensis]
MDEKEKVLLIQKISEDIMRLSVKDKRGKHESEQDKAIELLARAMREWTVMYLNPHSHHEDILKGTLAKVRIAYNALDGEKKQPKLVIKRL